MGVNFWRIHPIDLDTWLITMGRSFSSPIGSGWIGPLPKWPNFMADINGALLAILTTYKVLGA